MKVRVERQELAEAVAWLQAVRGRRPYMPALHGIRMEAVDGFLRLQATDLNQSGEVEIAAAIDEPGALLPSASSLHAVTSRLPDAPVTISGGDHLEIRAGRVTAKVPTLQVEDFPALPTVEPSATVTIPSTVLETIQKRIGAVVDPTHKNALLHGIWLSTDGGQFIAAATDSLAMHRFDATLEGDGKADAIVPASVFGVLAKLGHPLHVAFSDGRLEFAAPDRRLVTTLIEGSYPNVHAFFPDNLPDPVRIERDPLVESLKRCIALVAGVANVPLQLSASDGVIELAVANKDTGELVDSIASDVTFLSFAINPSLLLAAVEAVGSEVLDVRVTDPFKPVHLSDPAGGAVRALVMPMKTK